MEYKLNIGEYKLNTREHKLNTGEYKLNTREYRLTDVVVVVDLRLLVVVDVERLIR